MQRSQASTPPKKNNKTSLNLSNPSTEFVSQIEEDSFMKKIPSMSRRLQLLRNVSMPLHVKELLDKIEGQSGHETCVDSVLIR